MNKYQFLSVCILCFCMLQGFAQDTTYYKSPAKKTRTFKKCDYFVVIDRSGPKGIRLTKFSREGIKDMELLTTDALSQADLSYFSQKDGRVRIWYASGQLMSQYHNKGGMLEKQVITYWPTGKIKRNDFFEHDVCIAGKCFDSTGAEIPHFPYRVMPEFPGGMKDLNLFLATHIIYPEADRKNGTQGRVLARFTIDPKGEIGDIQIMRSPSPDMSREVVRLLKQMPRWRPGSIDGASLKVYYTLPVSFNLR